MMLADRVAQRARPVASADPVTLEEFGMLLGQSSGMTSKSRAGTTVSARRALGISAWYSGARYISETVAGLPIHRFQDHPDGRKRIADPQWMRRPDVEQPWFGLIEFALMSLLHRGDSFAWKVRNAAAQVVGLREIHPDRVTVAIAPDSTKRFMVDRDERLWTTRDILHIPGLGYDGRRGLNPIQYHADVLGSVVATDEYAARFFSNNTNLGGIISVEHAMTSTEAQDLKREWEDFHQGMIHAHRTGVLSKGARYDRVTLDAEDAQLIQARQYGVLEIARLLRLPPHKLYELSRATFSNIEHQSIEAITDGIQPWCERIEAFVNFDRDLTAEGTFVEFQLEGRLRGDTKARFEAYSAAIGGPWMAANEARRLENLPPVDGGDSVLRPLAMTDTEHQEGDNASPSAQSLRIAEIVQKAYLGVVNNVITASEARELLVAAGAEIPPDFPGGDL